MTHPKRHRVSLRLSQNVHLDLAGCTIYTERCPGCVPQRKKSMSNCDGSGCPHFDDIPGRASHPWPINITNEHPQQPDHMVPGPLHPHENLTEETTSLAGLGNTQKGCPTPNIKVLFQLSNHDSFREWKENKWSMKGECFHCFLS